MGTDLNIVEILTGYQHPREGFTLDEPSTEPVPFQMMFPKIGSETAETKPQTPTPDPHLYAVPQQQQQHSTYYTGLQPSGAATVGGSGSGEEGGKGGNTYFYG